MDGVLGHHWDVIDAFREVLKVNFIRSYHYGFDLWLSCTMWKVHTYDVIDMGTGVVC